jgi:hypothetical protein
VSMLLLLFEPFLWVLIVFIGVGLWLLFRKK